MQAYCEKYPEKQLKITTQKNKTKIPIQKLKLFKNI